MAKRPGCLIPAKAKRILRAIRLLKTKSTIRFLAPPQRLTVTASIGFAVFPIEPARLPLSWERAIDLVDTAMYLAKAHGRNKAYGVERIHATDAVAAAQLTARLEAAWSEGRVGLTVLHGPTPHDGARPAHA